jgi:hypothetical protein
MKCRCVKERKRVIAGADQERYLRASQDHGFGAAQMQIPNDG